MKSGKELFSLLLGHIGIQVITFRKKSDFSYSRYMSFENPKYSEKLIRVGGSGDGSYLATKSLEDCTVLLSPGIGENISFDIEVASKGITVYMLDGNVSRVPEIPKEYRSKIHIERKNLSRFQDKDSIGINEWIQRCSSESDRVMFQMDIEGAEYFTLEYLNLENLNRIKLLVLEIHGFHLTTKSNYLGQLHRNLFTWLENEFTLVASCSNWQAGKTKVGKAWLPHAVETTWIRI